MTLRLGGWLVLAMVVLGIGAAGIIVHRSRSLADESAVFVNSGTWWPTSARSLAETITRWEKGMWDIMKAYDDSRDALAARDALLALKVAPDDRDVHFRLVGAFQLSIDGSPQAAALLQEARHRLILRLTATLP